MRVGVPLPLRPLELFDARVKKFVGEPVEPNVKGVEVQHQFERLFGHGLAPPRSHLCLQVCAERDKRSARREKEETG